MNKTSNILWGIVLIIIGLIFGLNALEITHIDIFFNGWWTLFIIVPCFIDLFKEKDKTGNIIGIIIGILLLLGTNNIIDFSIIWKLMFPIALVTFGLSLIFKDTINGKIKKEMKKINENTDKEYYATFSLQNLDFTDEEFENCNLNAVFGGIKCDLRNATLKKDVIINASSIFGGITLYIPENTNVKLVSTPIFGGVSDERKKHNNKDADVTIYVNAICMFGGIELKWLKHKKLLNILQ